MDMTIRMSTYFKGGPDDNFMSGRWVGNVIQDHVMFVNCDFNGVAATFIDCVFVDCCNPPQGIRCLDIDLPRDKRLKVEFQDPIEPWGWS